MRKFEKNEKFSRFSLIFWSGNLRTIMNIKNTLNGASGVTAPEDILQKLIKFGHVKFKKSITFHKFSEILCADLDRNIILIKFPFRAGGQVGGAPGR